MAGKTAQTPWTTVGEEKRSAVRQLFAEISSTYDLMNSAMSFRLHHRWRRAAATMLWLRPGERALDLCCGTGDFARPLAERVGKSGLVAGLDFCLPMLDRARKKRVPMFLMAGDACRLPVKSASFDAVTIGWGLRNVSDLPLALSECRRVLASGGRMVSLDMALPRSSFLRSVSGLTCQRFVPILGGLLGKKQAYQHLPQSTLRFASREELAEAMKGAGFRNVRWRDLFFGNICIHYGEK
jgi:demethylmenaquinone methyltransferase/2-methoxy-6-polyprenyl-1,4-benzoquinol methylase